MILSPLRAGDADDLVGLLEEPRLREWLAASNAGELRARFATWESRRSPTGDELWLNWIVRSRSDARALGWVQASVRADAGSIAYALVASERGVGAAADAVRTVTRWLRDRLRVCSLEAHIDQANVASERVARAAGFTATQRRVAGETVWVLA